MEFAKKFGMKNGVIMGIIGLVYTYAIWAINDDLFISLWWVSTLLFLVALALFVAAQVQTKKAQGGFASFREVFSAFMIGSIVYLLISLVGGMLLFQVIDNELGPKLQEGILMMTEERLESAGLDEERIAEELAKIEDRNSFSFMGQLKSTLMSIVFFAIVGAIASLIVRKNKPEWEETIDQGN